MVEENLKDDGFDTLDNEGVLLDDSLFDDPEEDESEVPFIELVGAEDDDSDDDDEDEVDEEDGEIYDELDIFLATEDGEDGDLLMDSYDDEDDY